MKAAEGSAVIFIMCQSYSRLLRVSSFKGAGQQSMQYEAYSTASELLKHTMKQHATLSACAGKAGKQDIAAEQLLARYQPFNMYSCSD